MHHPLSEDYKEQILEQTLLVQTDAFYEETPEARRELSDQLVAAQYDYDLQALDDFVKAPSFTDLDSDDGKLKKLTTLGLFRRPSQLRWGASNSLIIQGEEGEGEISFLSIVSDLEAQASKENQ